MKTHYRVLRVAAYCRVSTKQEEQLNSYENQVEHYTERINSENGWTLEGIYADKGISGTSVKNRDEFNRMIRRCKQGKIDMIITKSIARFARNTVDCLKYVRLLNELGVDVYFEEQGIHSNQPGAEFYITIYGSIAQSESENISANIKWGKAQAAREGKVVFRYKNFLGYRKGDDGQPEIVPEEAETIRFIYDRFLAGDSLKGIAKLLEEKGIKSPTGKAEWQFSTIQSILSNERYKGDAIINKTYITDCISKKVRVNNGERPKYYVENSHPAIIDSATFGRVQEELARRSGKRKVRQKAKTEQGKYSSKYAMTELLVCGECKSAYRRCTWTSLGRKYPVWRCTSRLNYGTKYCHDSPTIKEEPLQTAILAAVNSAMSNKPALLDLIKNAVSVELLPVQGQSMSLADIERHLEQLDEQFQRLLAEAIDAEDKEACNAQFAEILSEQTTLKKQKEEILQSSMDADRVCAKMKQAEEAIENTVSTITEWNENAVRQIVERVTVLSADEVLVRIRGGAEIKQRLER